MANTITSNVADFVPEIWLNVALNRLRNYLGFTRTVTHVDRDLQPGAFRVGSTVDIPKYGTLVAQDKVEGTPFTPQAPQSSKVQLVLNRHVVVPVEIEDRALSFVNQDVIAGYMDNAMIALAERIESDGLGLYSQVTNTVTNAGTMTEANILSARKILADNKVPLLERKYAQVATSQTNALLQIDRFTRYDALGVGNNISDATIGNGHKREMPSSFGMAHGFEFGESQLAPTSGTGGANANNLLYSKRAFMFASRELASPAAGQGAIISSMTDPETDVTLRLVLSYDHKSLAQVMSVDCLYGWALLRPELAVNIITSA